jgi:hypothetical protein
MVRSHGEDTSVEVAGRTVDEGIARRLIRTVVSCVGRGGRLRS